MKCSRRDERHPNRRKEEDRPARRCIAGPRRVRMGLQARKRRGVPAVAAAASQSQRQRGASSMELVIQLVVAVASAGL